MTTLELPDPALKTVPLSLTNRRVLGPASHPPEEVLDRISIGRPACVPLDPSTIDEDARIFLEQSPESAYRLLALTCSFRAVDNEPMETAWLDVRLRTTEPEDVSEPTAWSMEPLAVYDEMQVSKVARLDASLKLTSEVVPIEVGPSVGREQHVQYEKRAPYVEAHREGTSRPAWLFTRTPITEIRGVHRLRMVIEIPAGSTGDAEVSAGATLRLKHFGVIAYRAQLDDVPEHRTVVLSG